MQLMTLQLESLELFDCQQLLCSEAAFASTPPQLQSLKWPGIL